MWALGVVVAAPSLDLLAGMPTSVSEQFLQSTSRQRNDGLEAPSRRHAHWSAAELQHPLRSLVQDWAEKTITDVDPWLSRVRQTVPDRRL